ncbi:MAG: ABC transporter permease [Dehalococcoidia bacterium]|nr:MAG: ABC transporter permease [Dehalococcoidia bacterium]
MLDVVSGILSFSFYEGLVFGLVAIGVYLTFRVLSFPDLSVDGTFPLGGAISAVLIVNGVHPFAATLAAGGLGLCAGLVTGLLNTKLRLPALLAGILVMVGLYSINLRIMSGANVSLLREVTAFDKVGGFLGVSSGSIVTSIAVALAIAVIVFIILNWFLRTEIGLALRATGDNEQMVRGLGTDTDKNILMGCAISNGLVGLAGAVVAQGQGFADVGMGIGMIVMGLASVIIGEGIFRPKGVASLLLAAVGGAFLYRLFITLALRLGMAPGDLKLITAVLVIIVLAVPYIRKKMRGEWVPPAVRW